VGLNALIAGLELVETRSKRFSKPIGKSYLEFYILIGFNFMIVFGTSSKIYVVKRA